MSLFGWTGNVLRLDLSRGEIRREDLDARGDILAARRSVGETRVIEQVGAADAPAEALPVALRLEHHERDPAAVARLVARHQRVHEAAIGRVGVVVRIPARDDVCREHPRRRGQQRDVHDRGQIVRAHV